MIADDEAEDPLEEIADKLLTEHLTTALDQLEPREQEVLRLRYACGSDADAGAEASGLAARDKSKGWRCGSCGDRFEGVRRK